MNKTNTIEDEEIDQKFEKLLSNMDLKDEHKRLLQHYTMDTKKAMLSIESETSKLHTPQYYINSLENYNESNPSDILRCLESLKIALINYPLSWVHEFGSKGLLALFDVLEFTTKLNSSVHEKIQLECLKCISKFNTNVGGLEEFLRQESGQVIVAKCIDYRKPSAMIEALKILIVLCTNTNKVLLVLEKLSKIKKCDRFLPIIEAISMTSDDILWSICLQFINFLLSEIDDIVLRMHLRNEFLSTGLHDVLKYLKNHKAAVINEQFSIFCKTKDADKLQMQLLANSTST